MGIQGINNNTVSWEALLNAVNQASGATKTEGVSSENPNVVFSTTIDGIKQNVTLPIPDDLELPSLVDDGATIDELLLKLGGDTYTQLPDGIRAQMREQLSQAYAKLLAAAGANATNPATAGSATSGGTNKVLFDLYKLLALMVEVAQQQRDSTRELRSAQSQQIQASIQAQADQQMFAAWLGIGLSVATAAVQVAVTAVSLVKTQGAYSDKLQSSLNSGVPSAQQNMQMIRAADNSVNSGQQLARVDHAIGNQRYDASGNRSANAPTVHENVVAKFNAQDSNTNQALGRLTNAQATLEGDTAYQNKLANTNVQNATTDEAIAGMRDGSLKEAATDLKEFRALENIEEQNLTPEQSQKLTALKGKYDAADTAELKTKLEGKVDGEIAREKAAIDQKVDTGRIEVENARVAYRSAIKSDMRVFEDAYDAAVAERTSLQQNGASSAEIKAADLKVNKAAKELEFARAYGNDKLMGTVNNTPITTEVDHAADLKQAMDRFDAAEAARRTDIGGLKADRKLSFWENISQMNNALGNMMQGVNQGAVGIVQAKATQMGAQQQRLQEELDQIKDLHSQSEDVIKAAIQLLVAIQAAEAQSMRDAIQA